MLEDRVIIALKRYKDDEHGKFSIMGSARMVEFGSIVLLDCEKWNSN